MPARTMADDRTVVFAAASLHGVLAEIASHYTGDVAVSVGGSGQIARQIAQGAPADVVILASAAWMDWLEEQGSVDHGRRVDLVGNRLVLIGPSGASELPDVTADALLERLDGGRIAMGQTRGVPAGIYGREWLEAAGLWAAMEPHLAETDSVRAALALVARGEAPLGIVYVTDAAAEAGVRILYGVPDALHAPIVYPAAALTEAGKPFVEFLQADAARKIFAAHGFVLPGGTP
ncbi:molybdate ABC transporter substrate-binding protein [Roseovarius arcticus]|uniref:molybdate ABC transporter substrate-binding protein n=1 Tax=Roseovarius arcticus TaxID=2547404 RepID=UPI0011104156|nr:molybdate ABC transporter substrate-binding protein [Roseovarius arcticus]